MDTDSCRGDNGSISRWTPTGDPSCPCSIETVKGPDMFLVQCPATGNEHLRSVDQIVDHANTDHGVMTAVTCACGGHVILRHGDQVAHSAPNGGFAHTA